MQQAQLSPMDRQSAMSVETVRNVAKMFVKLRLKNSATGE